MTGGASTIAVVGPITGGSRSVAAAAARALRRLGHDVTFVDNARFAPDLEAIRAAPDPQPLKDAMTGELFKLAAASTREQLVSLRPRLALYLAQAPVLSDADTAPVRAAGTLTVLWFVEDFRLFTYWQHAARRYDVFWAIQAGDFPARLAAAGQPHVDHVPLACDPELHRSYAPTETAPYAGRVAFAGSAYPNRVRLLTALADLDVRLWGPGFARHPALAARVAFDGTLPHEALARIFAATAINLNLASSPHEHAPAHDFVNPRAFEIAGCGGFQLIDAAIPIEPFFEPATEVVRFASIDEARAAIARFVDDEPSRAAIAARAQRRAHAEHSYERRLHAALRRLPW
jgi:spore maturation protein CgeB